VTPTERRSCSHPDAAARIETRDDGKPVIVGYAAVYHRAADPGTEFVLYEDPGDGFRFVERIAPGAFDRAAREDDVRALFNHDPDHVLGRAKAGTLRLTVDERGLRYEIDPPDTQTARDVTESLRRGDISGSSFAFNIRGETVEKSPKLWVRTLTDVDLYDVGPVTYPAYKGTEAGVRSEDSPSVAALLAERAAADADLLTVTLALLDAGD
jgi:HK97 family phage prohead protease